MPNINARAADSKVSAEYRRQQLQAKAIPKREPTASVAGHVRAVTSSAAMSSHSAASSARPDITAELNAVMKKTGTSNHARGASRAVPVAGRQQQRMPPGQPARGQGGPQAAKISQEQVIVGHFCRFAIKTLTKVMEGSPLKQTAEVSLKEHIKKAWAQWVRGHIPRQKLLESVARFVRDSCPQAIGIDLIREFKEWYESEFERQKAQSARGERKMPQQQFQHVGQQQRRQVVQNKQMPLHIHQMKQQQARSAVLQPQGANAKMQYSMPGTVPGRAAVGSKASGKEAQLINPHIMKKEAQLPGKTGGKSISRKTVPSRKTSSPTTPKAGASRAAPGKAPGVRSIGGKSISRPPSTLPAAHVALKGPTTTNVPKVSVMGGVAGKAVTGSKGLLANKLPAGLVHKVAPGTKPKGPRKAPVKNAAKTSPLKGAAKSQASKSLSKTISKGSVVRQKPSLPVIPGSAGAGSAAVAPGSIKRPFDASSGSPTGSSMKKPKPTPKASKGPTNKRKAGPYPSSTDPNRPTKPQPARIDTAKGRTGPGNNMGSGGGSALATGKGGSSNSALGATGTGTQVRKVKRVDDELNLVNDVVDLDDEVDKLGEDAGVVNTEVIEIIDYDPGMLLSGPALRTKMQVTAKRYALSENISKDAMEIVSLAVQERLRNLLESLKGIARVRVEANKESWNTEYYGQNVHEKLELMREDEERSLTVAAELRVKRKKEQEEREAKKLAGEAEMEEKKIKDASAAAELERKEKIALEKKRKENSSQRDALSGLVAGIDKRRKKPTTGKGLAGLAPLLPPITKSGGSRTSGSSLPPIPKLVSSAGGDSMSKSAGTNGKKVDQLEKLKALCPLVSLGGPRASSMPGTEPGVKKDVPKPQPKLPLTLRDCIFLMESEQNTRKSSHIYKWYARLNRVRQVVKGK